MPRKPTNLIEEIVDSGGGVLPDPVDTGNPHANRPQDNLQGEQEVADVPGVGDVPRAAILNALLSKLVGMDGAQLAQVASTLSLTIDVVANPTAGMVNADAATNLQTITTKEDVAELFAGEELSEEFIAKAEVIFEAAVQARCAGFKAELDEKIQKIQEEAEAKVLEISEQAEKEVEQAVVGVTDELVEQIDKYLTFVAEDYVERNKVVIEETARNTLAVEVLNSISSIVSRYSVVSENIDPLADMAAKIEALEAQLQEALDANIERANALKDYRRKEIVSEAAESLTSLQKSRLFSLTESIDFSSDDELREKVTVIKNQIMRKDEATTKVSVIAESNTSDGVPLADDGSAVNVAPVDTEVNAVLSYLKRGVN